MDLQSDEEKTDSSGPWMKCLESVTLSVQSILPEGVWLKISPNFYVTFWQLNLYDIHVPKSRYETEIKKQRGIANSKTTSSGNANAQDVANRLREKQTAALLLEKLEKELQVQESHSDIIMARLEREKDAWFYECMFCRCFNRTF